jgi:hypothetical protein
MCSVHMQVLARDGALADLALRSLPPIDVGSLVREHLLGNALHLVNVSQAAFSAAEAAGGQQQARASGAAGGAAPHLGAGGSPESDATPAEWLQQALLEVVFSPLAMSGALRCGCGVLAADPVSSRALQPCAPPTTWRAAS